MWETPALSKILCFIYGAFCFYVVVFFQIYTSEPNPRETSPVSEMLDVFAGIGVK